MEIYLNNFRSFTEQSFIFNEGNNLISGESGVGKSTILEAIFWCFYGGSSVTPFSSSSKKIITKVSVKINDITIIRTKPPEKCKVILENNTLEHDEAQEYIYNTFGSKSLWEASSYLKQDSRASLLFHSSQEKYELIKEIVFGRGENSNSPEKYQEKLSIFSKDLDKNLDVLTGKIEVLKNSLEEEIENFSNYQEIEKNTKKLSKFLTKEEEVKNTANKLRVKILENEKLLEYKERLEISKNMIKEYPELTLENIEKWKIWYKSTERLKELDTNFEKINVTSEDIKKLELFLEMSKKEYRKYVLNTNICNKLGVKYCKDSVEKEIKKNLELSESIKEYQNYLKIMNNIKKIDEKINLINENLRKFDEKEDTFLKIKQLVCEKLNIPETEELENIKFKLKSVMTNYLNCPKCSQKLLLEEGELKVKKCHFMKKEDLENYTSKINSIEQFYIKKNKLVQELKNYEKIKNEMKIPEEVKKIEGNIEDIKSVLNKLREIEIIEYDKNLIKEKEDLLDLYKKNILLSSLEKNISDNHLSFFDEYPVPSNFSEYFKCYQKVSSEIKMYSDTLEKSKIENKEELIKNLEKFEKLISDLGEYKRFLIIKDKKNKLEDNETSFNVALKKRETCNSIKKIIDEESSNTFENLITNFNDLLNEIVSEIFDDIHITLGMFKKMKGKGTIKPQFNMKVILKGNEYDNLNFLSGGEKDRISIALTLTLSTILNNPIIMFDESMSSLDEEMREKCLYLIKKYAGDKILINICHYTVEGCYDNVIKV